MQKERNLHPKITLSQFFPCSMYNFNHSFYNNHKYILRGRKTSRDNKKYVAKARKSNISTYPIRLHLFSAIFLSFCDFDHKPVALFGRYDGVVFRFSLTPYGDTRASTLCEHLHFLQHFVLCRVDIFMRKILLIRVRFRRSGLCKIIFETNNFTLFLLLKNPNNYADCGDLQFSI